MNYKGRTSLYDCISTIYLYITGAGGGIGRAICQLFLPEGATLVLVDVIENSLKETVTSLEGNA